MTDATVDVVTGELVPVSGPGLVVPVAPIPDIVRRLNEYEETCKAVLRRDDWQAAGQDGRFVVKSGWRRLAFAWGLDDELVDRLVEETPDGRIRRVTTVVRAVHSNGRGMTGVGVASLRERCCELECNKSHRHCPAANGNECSGTRHWTKPDHSISATSFTRALSRAIEDLTGGAPSDDGEEDRDGWAGGHDAHDPRPPRRTSPRPPRATREAGPERPVEDDTDADAVEDVRDRVMRLDADLQSQLSLYLASANIPTPIRTAAQARAVARWLSAFEEREP